MQPTYIYSLTDVLDKIGCGVIYKVKFILFGETD